MRAYVMKWIRNPDPRGVFYKKTRLIRILPDFVLLLLFPALGYGGWLFIVEGLVVGHVFYQTEKDALKIFSVAHTLAEHQGMGTTLVRAALCEIENMLHIRRVRVGAGGDPAVKRLWEKIIEGTLALPFEISRGEDIGWLTIERTTT
jgi:hypothetical protein